MKARQKTSIASLTAGAVMIFIFGSALIEVYLIPESYKKTYQEVVRIPLILIGGFAITAYGRKRAKAKGEDFPF